MSQNIQELSKLITSLGGKPTSNVVNAQQAFQNMSSTGIKIWGNPQTKKKVALGISLGGHLYFFGPAGVGKSTMARAILEGARLPYYRFQGYEGFTADDWYGSATLDSDGKIVVNYSAMVKAVEEGCPVLVEEMNFIQPTQMGPLFSFLDDTPWVDVTVAGKTRRVVKKKGFRLMVTANDNGSGDQLHLYGGGQILNRALASRFSMFIDIPYLNVDDETDMIIAKTGLAEKDVLKAMMQVAEQTRKLASAEPSKAELAISPRSMLDWAKVILVNDESKAGLDHMSMAIPVLVARLPEGLQDTVKTFVSNAFGNRLPLTDLKRVPVTA